MNTPDAIRNYAADVYSWSSCTVDEYLDLNPSRDTGDFVTDLIEANADVSEYDAHDLRLFRNELLRLANSDCHRD